MCKGYAESFTVGSIIFKLEVWEHQVTKEEWSLFHDLDSFEFTKVPVTISAPARYEAWTDSLKLTWSSLLSVQIKNPMALPNMTKLVKDRLDYKSVLRGAPEMSVELNKAQMSHRTLLMSESGLGNKIIPMIAAYHWSPIALYASFLLRRLDSGHLSSCSSGLTGLYQKSLLLTEAYH